MKNVLNVQRRGSGAGAGGGVDFEGDSRNLTSLHSLLRALYFHKDVYLHEDRILQQKPSLPRSMSASFFFFAPSDWLSGVD